MKIKALSLLALLPLAASCASQKVVDDYEAEIAALREERTSLKADNNALRGQLDQTQVALSNASSELDAARADIANAPTLPSFDNGVEVGMRGGDLVISIPSSISFPSGSASLSKSGQSALQQVADVLLRDHADGIYWIEGHTDSDQISKSKFKNNRDLAAQRAMSVLEHLVGSCNVPDESRVLVSHGQYMPLAENNSKEGKAKNRRVEIVVHK